MHPLLRMPAPYVGMYALNPSAARDDDAALSPLPIRAASRTRVDGGDGDAVPRGVMNHCAVAGRCAGDDAARGRRAHVRSSPRCRLLQSTTCSRRLVVVS